MKDYHLYDIMTMPDPSFPVKVMRVACDKRRLAFPNHWHEHMELIFVTAGKGIIECNQIPYEAVPGDLVVVNGSELHQGECVSGDFAYFCIIMDLSQLLGEFNNTCRTKYIEQISQNLILFKNILRGNPAVTECVTSLIREYEEKKAGFELEIISSVCRLIAILLRDYMEKLLTAKEYDLKVKSIERLKKVFSYIEANYTEKITILQCAKLLNVTDSHFCHLFKLATGKSLSNYVNYFRLKKAEALLQNTALSVTEIALATGFNDIAYFSRLFKKYKKSTPLKFRMESRSL
ncbi:MAG: AraC family transcriptional regulator [Bacillota bacterium]